MALTGGSGGRAATRADVKVGRAGTLVGTLEQIVVRRGTPVLIILRHRGSRIALSAPEEVLSARDPDLLRTSVELGSWIYEHDCDDSWIAQIVAHCLLRLVQFGHLPPSALDDVPRWLERGAMNESLVEFDTPVRWLDEGHMLGWWLLHAHLTWKDAAGSLKHLDTAERLRKTDDPYLATLSRWILAEAYTRLAATPTESLPRRQRRRRGRLVPWAAMALDVTRELAEDTSTAPISPSRVREAVAMLEAGDHRQAGELLDPSVRPAVEHNQELEHLARLLASTRSGKKNRRPQLTAQLVQGLRRFERPDPFPTHDQLALVHLLHEWRDSGAGRRAGGASAAGSEAVLAEVVRDVVARCWPDTELPAPVVIDALDELMLGLPGALEPTRLPEPLPADDAPEPFDPTSWAPEDPVEAEPALVVGPATDTLIQGLQAGGDGSPAARRPGLGTQWYGDLALLRATGHSHTNIVDGLRLALDVCRDSSHLDERSADTAWGSLGLLLTRALDHHLTHLDAAAAALTELEARLRRRLDDARRDGRAFDAILECGLVEVRRASGQALDAPDVSGLAAAFGRGRTARTPDSVVVVQVYCRTMLRSRRGHWSSVSPDVYRDLLSELEQALSFTEGDSVWHADVGGTLRLYAARALERLAELLPVLDRSPFLGQARDHLLAGIDLPGLSSTMREMLIREWHMSHFHVERPPEPETARGLHLSTARRLYDTYGAAARPALINALVLHAGVDDLAEAWELIGAVDASELSDIEFIEHLTSATDTLKNYVRSRSDRTFHDPVPAQYEQWMEQHPDAELPAVDVRMAQHYLHRFDLTANLGDGQLGIQFAFLARERVRDQHLEGQEVAVIVAGAMLECLEYAGTHLSAGDESQLLDAVEWACDPAVTPRQHISRPTMCRHAAGLLSRLGNEHLDRSLALLDEAAAGYRLQGRVGEVRAAQTSQLVLMTRRLGPDPEPTQLVLLRRSVDEVRAAGPEGDSPGIELTLLSGVLLLRHASATSASDPGPANGAGQEDEVGEAVALQDRALRMLLALPEHRLFGHLATAADLVEPVDVSRFPDEAERVTQLLVKASSVALLGFAAMMRNTRKLLVQSAHDPRSVEGMARWSFLRLFEVLDQVEDQRAPLSAVQGVCTDVALRLAAAGEADLASQWAERGCAVEMRKEMNRRRPEGSVDVTIARPVAYLIFGDTGGYAIAVSDGAWHVVGLAALTTLAVDSWTGRLSSPVDGAGLRARALDDRVAGLDAPRVLEEMQDAIRPLLAWLDDRGTEVVDWIPVGRLSALPWQAALISMAGRRRPVPRLHMSLIGKTMAEHNEKAMREAGTEWHQAQLCAVTNPSPCTVDGKEAVALPGATLEGLHLQELLPYAHVLDGAAATRANVLEVLSGDFRTLHLAAHGYAEPGSITDAEVFLCDEAGSGTSSPLTLDDVRKSSSPFALVWLGACWAGRPNELLPDEARGLPSAFIGAAACSVVAPLWPVDDTLAHEFARAFYDEWLGSGRQLGEAFRTAMLITRSLDPTGCTWPAFTLTGTFDGGVNLNHGDDAADDEPSP